MTITKAARFCLLALLPLAVSACSRSPSQGEIAQMLAASWQSYRLQFISPEGRVVIPERGRGTISEAQAYALLRAAWAGDAATFAKVYAWTYQNLSRPDHLLSWHWGQRADGSWGVLDANTASDGDLDYALALILAARRGWRAPPGRPDYLAEARKVAASIMNKEVAALPGGTLVLTPGDWHETGPPYLLNPSYFSPAVYRLFGQVWKNVEQPPPAVPPQARAPAPQPPAWDRLHQDTYQLLTHLNQGLGKTPGVGLFPDWCKVDAAGMLSAVPNRDSQFGWEATRLPWRLSLDHLWFQEPQAAQVLRQKFLPFFKQEWQARRKLAAVYNYDGTPAVDYESPVIYAGVLAAALAAGDRDFAAQMAKKIQGFYQEKDGRAYFVSPDNYYANNWAWLGLAMYAGWVKP